MRNKAYLYRQFCCHYAKLGNVREAAAAAGFPPEKALSEGLKILGEKKYRDMTERFMSDRVSESALVRAGLERIAFGSANDAAYLVFSEEIPEPEKLEKLDLFNVSEIKRVKGGGVEIKLFDRQKAMERLYEYSDSGDNKAAEFIKALAGMEESGEDEV